MSGKTHPMGLASIVRLLALSGLVIFSTACLPAAPPTRTPTPLPRPATAPTATPTPLPRPATASTGTPTPRLRPATTPPPGATGLAKIDHFVFILQENRSFDSYFGMYPGVDGTPSGVCLENPAGGPCVAPYHDPDAVNRGAPHDLAQALPSIDLGRMDGFVAQAYTARNPLAGPACPPTQPHCPPGSDPRDVMGWHDDREIPNYWTYAAWFVLQDHMFSSVPSYTLPNRLYLLAAQSGGYLSYAQVQPQAFAFPTIIDRLTAQGIDWRYYVTSGTELNPADGTVIGSLTDQRLTPFVFGNLNPLPHFPSVMDNPAESGRMVDTAQFYADARSGHLPAVSWVIPSMAVSEHPPYSIRVGMAYVTALVNAVMTGPDWATTAIFLSYDEWGGFYDHVPPPTLAGESLGIRAPGLVISPYARQGYVDHAVHSPASWLRLVEERYQLAPLSARDASADDMLVDFDFTQQPRPSVILDATRQGSAYHSSG